MKQWATLVLAFVACLATLTAQSTDKTSGSVQKAFAAGGHIRLTLSAGDYHISGSPDSGIRVEWKVRYADEAQRVHVDTDVQAARAHVNIEGPSNHFSVRVQVPTRSDLYVRLTAGDLDVDAVDGNKDIELHAGDMRIDMGRPEAYKHVDASIWAGDLEIRPLRVSKGGLFRSYEWKGDGAYSLHAHLKAGDLRIR
jgi:hypothetical protein